MTNQEHDAIHLGAKALNRLQYIRDHAKAGMVQNEYGKQQTLKDIIKEAGQILTEINH